MQCVTRAHDPIISEKNTSNASETNALDMVMMVMATCHIGRSGMECRNVGCQAVRMSLVIMTRQCPENP